MADILADTRDIERLFPLVQPGQSATVDGDREEDEGDIEARIEEVRKHISWVQLDDGDDDAAITKPARHHQRYQTIEDLSGPARVFHERAAECSGLSVEELLRAVFRLEQKLQYFQQVEKSGINIDDMEGIEEGVPSRPVARLLSVKESWS